MTDLKSTAISIEATIHAALDNFFEEIHRDYGVRIESVHVDWSHFGIISTRLETSRVRPNTIGGS